MNANPKLKKVKVWQYFTRYPQRWITGSYHKNGGKCCLAGAIENQYGTGHRYRLAAERIMDVLRRRAALTRYQVTPTITEWNDQAHRTVKEVVELCKVANV